MERLLSVSDVANYFGIAEGSVYRFVRQRKLRYVKVGTCVRFHQQDIARFLEERTVQPKENKIKKKRPRTSGGNHELDVLLQNAIKSVRGCMPEGGGR